MSGEEEQGVGASRSDEVAELARKYLEEPDRGGYREIERQCHEAAGESRWDDVSKWHRVRLRYLRLQQERDLQISHRGRDSSRTVN